MSLLLLLDPRSLAIAASLAGLVFSGVLWAALRDGSPIPGTRYWFVASILLSAALAGNALQDFTFDFVSRVIANTLLLVAGFLLWHGARVYNRNAGVLHWMALAAGMAAIANIVFTYIVVSVPARISVTSIGLAISSALTVIEVRKAQARHLAIGVRVVALSLSLFAVFMIGRTVHAALGFAPTGALVQTPMNSATHLIANAVLLATMAGLVIIVNSTRAAQVRALAYTDQLTGVLSRRGFYSAIQGASGHELTNGCVFVFDIDRFKEINDSKGHETGDQILRILGDALRETAPRGALIARFGGDEFVMLAKHVPDPASIVDRVQTYVREQSISVLNTRTLFSTSSSRSKAEVSIGWAKCPRIDEPHLSNTLHEADAAMYRVKTRRREIQLQDANPAAT